MAAASTTKYHLVVVKTETSTGTPTHTAKKVELKADSDALDSVITAIAGGSGSIGDDERNALMTSLVKMVDTDTSIGAPAPASSPDPALPPSE